MTEGTQHVQLLANLEIESHRTSFGGNNGDTTFHPVVQDMSLAALEHNHTRNGNAGRVSGESHPDAARPKIEKGKLKWSVLVIVEKKYEQKMNHFFISNYLADQIFRSHFVSPYDLWSVRIRNHCRCKCRRTTSFQYIQ